jgi:hypothetical protein
LGWKDLLGPCNKWKALRVLDDLLGEVDIEIGPIEMPAPRLLDIQDGYDGSILEPRELCIGLNSSLSLASSQTPWAEICVTSTPEVLVPSANDPVIVVLHNNFSFLELLARQPVVPSQL